MGYNRATENARAAGGGNVCTKSQIGGITLLPAEPRWTSRNREPLWHERFCFIDLSIHMVESHCLSRLSMTQFEGLKSGKTRTSTDECWDLKRWEMDRQEFRGFIRGASQLSAPRYAIGPFGLE